MEINLKEKKRAIGFDIKISWLAISRMYNQLAQKAGFTSNIGFVLLHIDDKAGTPATKIAPLMGMESRSLTRMLNKLEEIGFIYRQADEKDRRMVRIFLTEEGMRHKALSKEVVIGFNKVLYNTIPQDKLQTFFEVLDSIQEVTKSYHHAGS